MAGRSCAGCGATDNPATNSTETKEIVNPLHKALLCLSIFSLSAQPTLAQESERAAELFQEVCSQCHGENLQGGMAQSLIDGIWQFGEGSIEENIKHGLTHVGMPAFEATLTDDEVEALAEYLESVEEELGVTKPPPPTKLQTLDYEIDVALFAEDLEIPWAIDFLDENTALITERPGRLRVVHNDTLISEPITGTPKVLHEGQGGLLDVAVDPDYAENGWVYLSYSHEIEPEAGNRTVAMTRIVRGRLRDGAWADEQVVYEAPHDTYILTRHHYGSRIVFDPEGHLYFSIGERGIGDDAQDISMPNGKIHRIYRDGGIPSDNPFVDTYDALPTIFTYGNRNPQGLAIHPQTGQLWETEHGPMGGDELNVLLAARNYGWPRITYGRDYSGELVSEYNRRPGMEQPRLFWRPSVAVCGLDFYTGNQFPKWQNRLLVGALRFEEVKLLTLDQGRVQHEEVILKNAGRVRDVTTGPDGAIYVVLNRPDSEGIVLRLSVIAERSYSSRPAVSDPF